MITNIATPMTTTVTTTIMTTFPPSDSSLEADSIFTLGVDNIGVDDIPGKSNN